jgi:hypothetical protein
MGRRRQLLQRNCHSGRSWHEIVSALHTEGEGSNVLEFRRSGQSATMVVVWTYYSTRTDATRSYTFDFTTFDLQAEKQEPPL